MKDLFKQKRIKRQKRAVRARSKIFGTNERPRLCVFRSNKHIYAQIIDDHVRKTLVSASDLDLKKKAAGIEAAKLTGKAAAAKALAIKIKSVIFDRGGYKYHGCVKALAEGAREGGLIF